MCRATVPEAAGQRGLRRTLNMGAARAIIEAAGGIVTAWDKSEAASDRSVIAAANMETYNFFIEIMDKI